MSEPKFSDYAVNAFLKDKTGLEVFLVVLKDGMGYGYPWTWNKEKGIHTRLPHGEVSITWVNSAAKIVTTAEELQGYEPTSAG